MKYCIVLCYNHLYCCSIILFKELLPKYGRRHTYFHTIAQFSANDDNILDVLNFCPTDREELLTECAQAWNRRKIENMPNQPSMRYVRVCFHSCLGYFNFFKGKVPVNALFTVILWCI